MAARQVVKSGEQSPVAHLIRKAEQIVQRLEARSDSAQIIVMGVSHDWNPGREILAACRSANVVTLELPRNAVKAMLSDEPSLILNRNVFWRSVLGELRGDGSGRLVRGIEVNQNVRVGRKRLAFHFRDRTMSPSFFTIEVNDVHCQEIQKLALMGGMTEKELRELQERNWATVEDSQLAYSFMGIVTEALNRYTPKNFLREWPRQITEDFYLAGFVTKLPEDKKYRITFMKAPDESLVEAIGCISETLLGMRLGLEKRMATSISLDALSAMIFLHAELKEAEEILYSLNQYTAGNDDRGVTLLHLGGGYHARVVGTLLKSCIRNSAALQVSIKRDPRFRNRVFDGVFLSFFRDTMPFAEAYSIIKASGYEIYADPGRAADIVRSAVENNREEFRKRLLISRILARENWDATTLPGMRNFNRRMSDLSGMDMSTLRRISHLLRL